MLLLLQHRSQPHESEEEEQARLSDPEFEDVPDDDDLPENDENYDYLQATRRLDADELQAEEEGERLIDDQGDDGFVFGMKDDEREAAAFLAAGLDADADDADLIHDEDLGLDERREARARRAAERHLRARDRLRQSGDRKDIWRRLLEEDEDEAAEMERLLQRVQQRRRHLTKTATDGEVVNLRDLQQAKNLLADSNPRQVPFGAEHQQAVDTLFSQCFFTEHPYEGAARTADLVSVAAVADTFCITSRYQPITARALHAAVCASADKQSLEVDVRHLLFVSEQLVRWLELHPTPALQVLHDVVTAEAAAACPSLYGARMCQCLLFNWPYKTQLRALRCSDLNTLVCVSGVVTRRSAVLPRMRLIYLKCALCLSNVSDAPLQVVEGQKKINLPKRCPNCQASRFALDRLRTSYTDVQRLTLQESPSQCPPGRPPRQRELLLTGELVESAKPGETIEVLGVYRTKLDTALNVRAGFPVLRTEICANSIRTTKQEMIKELTDDDIKAIKELSRQPNVRERIIASIAPTLCASKQIKTALAYALFGGLPKGRDIPAAAAGGVGAHAQQQAAAAATQEEGKATAGQHVIRGDINVLLLGDPGLGKSQALQYVARTFPRSISTTGKGASACGLTAGVRRDPYSGEWSLEGGALVLADEGICLIDEFDKMSENDRVSIHEAMEQQSISISKAGIVTTLRARCSVIAAANPKFGRYIPSYTFKENVDLSDPILSRFDLICVLRDIPDADEDFSLADYVLSSHQLNHPNIMQLQQQPQRRIAQLEAALKASEAHEPINQELLQKYILYARAHCHPVLDCSLPALSAKLSSFYAKLRKRAAATGGLPLTLRHVESLLRISEANAKMRLSPTVSSLDVDFAISAVLSSFLSAQKFAVQQRLAKEFARYTALATGGWATLAALLRRLMQQRLQRAAALQPLQSQEADAEAAEVLLEQRDIEKCRKVDLEEFLRLASQHKFTGYQVEQWIASNNFKAHFSLLEEGNCKLLVSNNWRRDTASSAPPSQVPAAS
ncbi:DNA replication licensing factor mcm2 [Cyclospora cayetanensis]|uniref:DNA replication licensing factor MCM2 n=1 Tax=Cyclospora cayetanensis TaxID=88456 RepID=A0A6P6RSF8_9EIME|nr:DNA replication licensing factor mcm2 [Cyclospora cayetanensis]